jgi:Arc/MetJ family transcription regulator
VARHLVDIDESALASAQAELGTESIKEAVNTALRRVGRDGRNRVKQSLNVLANAHLNDRADAWRRPT